LSLGGGCCALSVGGLCDGLITRPEESCRVCDVSEYDRKLSITTRLWPTRAGCAIWGGGGLGGGLNDVTIHSKVQIAWKQIKMIANMDFSPHTHTHLNNFPVNLRSTL